MLVEMIAERKRFFAAQRAEQIRNKPPTRTQLRNKMITYLKNMGRFTHNQLKNRSLEEIQMLYEKEQKWIDDFVPMDSELEVQRLKRAGQEVLEKSVKRQKIGEASSQRFSITEPTDDKEKELWVELKRLFEPDNDDILWKLQRYMHDPLVWRLYDTCGVHHVSSVRGHDIFMLVEKDYPLSKGVLMLVNKLLVEQSLEMADELLRKIFIQANRPRQ
ncbi:hypothetical protein Tco_0781351 [Tanacetum coccineum]